MNITSEIMNYILQNIEVENKSKAVLYYLIERNILIHLNIKEIESENIKIVVGERLTIYNLGKKYFLKIEQMNRISLIDELNNILFRIDVTKEGIKNFSNFIRDEKNSHEYIKINPQEESYDYSTISISQTQEVYSTIVRAKRKENTSKRKEYFQVEYHIPEKFRQFDLQPTKKATKPDSIVILKKESLGESNYYNTIMKALKQKNEEKGPIRIKLK